MWFCYIIFHEKKKAWTVFFSSKFGLQFMRSLGENSQDFRTKIEHGISYTYERGVTKTEVVSSNFISTFERKKINRVYSSIWKRLSFY